MNKAIFFILLLLLLNISCKKSRLGMADESKDPIVTVLEHTLYKSDLEGITYYGMSPEDSTAAVQTFIKSWINDKLIYDIAKENISYRRDIEELVEEYRKALVVNDYQTRLLRERLSKSIPEQELLDFYNRNKERFNLSESIAKGLYLKVPIASSQLENFKKWYKLGTEAAIENIEKNALQNAVGYENFYDRWVSFNDATEKIPTIISNSEDFLKKNTYIENSDSTFVYLLHIKEYMLTGSEAPYEFIKDYLTAAYTEEKRDEFIKKLQSDLYNKALTNDQIKYYLK